MSIKKYRKKPVEVEAMQMPYESSKGACEVLYWVEENTAGSFDCLPIIEGDEDAFWPESGVSIDPRDGRMVIATLEGGHWVNLGDYVIRGVQGEFYPCKPDIFAETYEEADVEMDQVETWGGEPISSTCCGKCENECYVDYLTGERE